MQTFVDIDTYILAQPEACRPLLEKMRAAVRKAAPQAEESIGYGIPTFKLDGNLVHFGAAKKHLGFYPGASGVAAFAEELTGFTLSKGAIQFPWDTPVPWALITRIVKFRAKENKEKAAAKTRAKSKSRAIA